MIRSELLDICGMTAPTFNSHRRNGDLPFEASKTEAEDTAGRTWARYTRHDAALMLAARQLSSAHRVSWSEAARILRAPAIYSGGSFKSYFDRSGVHVAQVEFANEITNAEAKLFPQLQVYNGTLAEILDMAEGSVHAYNEKNTFKDYLVITSIVSVNLSNCWQAAGALAKSKGIDLSYEGSQRAAEADS